MYRCPHCRSVIFNLDISDVKQVKVRCAVESCQKAHPGWLIFPRKGSDEASP